MPSPNPNGLRTTCSFIDKGGTGKTTTIAHLENDGETPVRSKQIQVKYESVATSWASDPLTTLKSIQDHLFDLYVLGFLRRHERNQRLNGGQYFEYELDLDPSIVLSTRKDVEEKGGSDR